MPCIDPLTQGKLLSGKSEGVQAFQYTNLVSAEPLLTNAAGKSETA